MNVKQFYSNTFQILLEFDQNGRLSGLLRFPKDVSSFSKEFESGLYRNDGSKITCAFFTESAEIVTCYSGEIFKYFDEEECLILKYWSINKLFPSTESFANSQSLLFFDCHKKDPKTETLKVIPKIPLDVFSY